MVPDHYYLHGTGVCDELTIKPPREAEKDLDNGLPKETFQRNLVLYNKTNVWTSTAGIAARRCGCVAFSYIQKAE